MEQQKQQSLVQFVRRQLGYKGRTEHSGRGSYECDLPQDVKWADVKARVKSKAEAWIKAGKAKSIRSEVVEGVDVIEVVFDHNLYGSYNVLYLTDKGVENWSMYSILFTMDSFNNRKN